MRRLLLDWLLWPALVLVAAAGCVWIGWRAHARWGEPPPATVVIRSASGDAELPAGAVIGNIQSGIYHRPDCGHAGRIGEGKRAIHESPEAAEQSGLRPCRVCGDR